MASLLLDLIGILGSSLRSRHHLVLENTALRHQLQVLSRTSRRPKLTNGDRHLWIVLKRLWEGWRDALHLVQPDTVLGWHRRGFTHYWGRKGGAGPGRPRVSEKLRDLILRMSQANGTRPVSPSGWSPECSACCRA